LIGVLRGCVARFLPKTRSNSINLLAKLGIES
jgi:hypothetical protein